MMRELQYWADNNNNDSGSDSSDESEGESSQVPSQKRKNNTTLEQKKISDELLIGLTRLREEQMFFDVTIIAGTKKLRAHKIILCAASPYFNAMFTGSFVENNHSEVTLQDVDEEMVELLINYMYSGQLPFDSDNVDRVLLTAQFLQVDSAVHLCLTHIKEKTSVKNCLNLICFAGKHSLKNLCDALIEFIAKNFDKLFNSEDFCKINFLEFKRLFSDKRITSYPPDVILSTIARWVSHDYDVRIKHLDELLENLNPQHITREILESSSLLKKLKKLDLTKWCNKRPPVDVTVLTNWDVAVFKYPGNFTPDLYKLNSQAHADLESLPREFFDGSYASYGGAIYHTGGCLSKRPVSNETQCLSIYKNAWKNFVNLNTSRAYHRNCIVDANLYSIGGTDGGYSAFTSCEYIDLVLAQSITIKDLNKPRETMGLTAHNNVIYAIGGKNRGRCKYRCAERYDPRIGNWEILKSYSYESGISSCATIGEDIYCLTSGKSLERYDVRGDFWTKIITQFNSYPIELFTINGELYGIYKSNICLYETQTGKWKPPSIRFRYDCNNLTALPVLIAPSLRQTVQNNENNANDVNREDVGGIDENDEYRCNYLLSGLNELRENNQLCDISLTVPGGELIPAHKNVLSASSPYFAIMFNGAFDDSGKKIITLKDIDYESLKLVVEYLYTGNIRITTDNVQHLLFTSSFLQISWIQDKCCEFLEKSLDISNCLGIKQFADQHACCKLSDESVKFISKHFQEVSGGEEFLSLNIEELCDILLNDEIYDNAEDVIYCGVLQWVQCAPENRSIHLPDLLNFIHPSLVSNDLVKATDIVISSTECSEWTSKALGNVNNQYNIFILDKIGKTSNLSRFEMDTKEMWPLSSLPEKGFAVSFVGYKNFLYVLGGQSHPKTSRDTSFYYNIYRNRWLPLTPLLRSRSHHRSCILDGFLYSIGGNDYRGPMYSVECLDLITSQPIEVQGMLDARRSMAAVSHEKCLYVMGGEGNHECLYSMERYDPRIGSWQELSSMNQVNSYCSGAVIDNHIYCTEGLGNALEKYDFRMNTWEIIDLQEEREFYELFTIENELYSISGDFISKYCPLSNDFVEVLQFDETHEWDTAVSLKMQIL
ncbi:uncharacterized protein LOC129608092 [Condylostylus longicornis]|uniref:uncharacterized protein LOC129608092 n=1 Tax=Condylostylus longicornis TaxID=2530218 RepID=UPI00244E02CE|nr:uncharacterized protein LOC129608092 [Condylostylus longicornis]